jgi:hypothetical protein
MLLAVGGSARKAGKTSVVAGLIKAFPERRWTAVKITTHGHDPDVRGGQGAVDSPASLTEETTPGQADSGRYLAAGAARSYWLRAPSGKIADARRLLGGILARDANVIVESTSAFEIAEPDLFLMVVDCGNSDVKLSALRHAHQIDAFVVVGPGKGNHTAPAGKPDAPRFEVTPPDYVSGEVSWFVRARLSGF